MIGASLKVMPEGFGSIYAQVLPYSQNFYTPALTSLGFITILLQFDVYGTSSLNSRCMSIILQYIQKDITGGDIIPQKK